MNTATKEVPNPLLQENDNNKQQSFTIPQGKKVGIHNGFYKDLLGVKKSGGKSKFDEIVENLRPLLQERPGFKIRVTGHSLGASLAVLFTFWLAAKTMNDDSIPKPIRCINFACPRVGNIHFARAFRELELQGMILNLRIVNDKDIIPKLPDRLAFVWMVAPVVIYRHSSPELRMYSQEDPNTTHTIHYPKSNHKWIKNFRHMVKRTLGTTGAVLPTGWQAHYLKWHGCHEYMDRLQHHRDDLKKENVDAVYSKYVGMATIA